MWIGLTTGAFLVAMAICVIGWRNTKKRQAERLQEQQDLAKSSQVIEEQRRVMELVAKGASLKELIDRLTGSIERIEPDTMCTIMLLDEEDGRFLRSGSGPSVPPDYLKAIDRLPIGPDVGACGSAAFRNETVVVEDIATDYRFAGPKDFVMSFGLRSCWSVPIRNSKNKVLGTFAMYHRQPAKPRPQELLLVEAAAQLAGSAIESLRTEQRLRETAERLDLAENAAGFGIWEFDLASRSMTLSDGLAALTGLTGAARRQSLDDLAVMVHPEDLLLVSTAARQVTKAGDLRIEFRLKLPNGSIRWVRVQGRAQIDGSRMRLAPGALRDITDDKDRSIQRVTGALIDITEEKERLVELQSARAAAETAVLVAREAESLEQDRKTILEMVARDEPLDRIVEVLVSAIVSHLHGCSVSLQLESPGASRISVSLGLQEGLARVVDKAPIASFRQTLVAEPIASLSSDLDWQRFACNSAHISAQKYRAVPILQSTDLRGMIIAVSPRDRPERNEENKLLESWGQFASLGVERRALYEQLSFRAKHDSLTRLLNRIGLYERMDEGIRESAQDGSPMGVIYLDLDYFKEINDRYGHDAGDAVLQSVSRRIIRCVRSIDVAARVGGDEFIVGMPGMGDCLELRRHGDMMVREISQPIAFNGYELRVGASFGISTYPKDGRDTGILLKTADKDMYRAKMSRKAVLRSETISLALA
jgi:diguanylate cyclase (GGDEF)-like protein